MPRPRKWPPTIRTLSGRDYLRVGGRDIPLGPTGSPQARAEYARWLAVLEAHGGRLPEEGSREGLTVFEAVARWWAWARTRYPNTRELDNYRNALKPLGRLFGPTPLGELGPKRLAQVRAELALAYCRKVANAHLGRVKRVLKWLAAEELLPRGLWHDLQAVAGVRPGEARESEPVLPAPEAAIAASLPRLSPTLRAAAEVQLLTACRPGEVLAMRVGDLLRGEKVQLPGGVTLPTKGVWVYRPASHKGSWRGHDRLILVGPRAQAVLAPLLTGKAEGAYVFSPRAARQAAYARMRAARKSKVPPSQQDRRKAAPKRLPGERYSRCAYGRAVAAACAKAGCEHWHPNQLRHNAATRLVEQFDWEVARLVLGHRSVSTTQIYALDNLQKAVDAMSEAG